MSTGMAADMFAQSVDVMVSSMRTSQLVHAWRSLSSAKQELEDVVAQHDDLPSIQVRRIIVQVLVGTLVAMDSQDHLLLRAGSASWVPIPTATRKKLGASTTWNALLERRVLFLKLDQHGRWFDREGGRCAEYSLDSAFLWRFVRSSFSEAFSARPKWVDLLSGRPKSARKLHLDLPSEVTDLVAGPKVRIPLEDMRRRTEWMLRVAETAGRPDLRHRALRAMSGLVSILADPNTTKHRDGWATIVPLYRQHPNGRCYGVSGAFQALPREIKQVLLTAPGTPWQNLDLSTAHLAGLLRIASAINSVVKQCRGFDFDYIDTCVLRGIVQNGWDDFVHSSGLPTGLVKQVTNSMMMGSNGSYGDGKFRSAMNDALVEFVAEVRDRVAVHRRLMALLRPISMTLDKVRDHVRRMLMGKWYKPHGLIVPKGDSRHEVIGVSIFNGQTIVRNVVGGYFLAHSEKEGWAAKDRAARPLLDKVVSQVLSHVLTGIERQFMGLVMDACHDRRLPYLDEHDGIAVAGDVPDAVIDQAKKGSVLANYACLRSKPFLSSADDEYTKLAKVYQMPLPDVQGSILDPNRTLAERRRSIEAVLTMHPGRSDRDVAREFGCQHQVVGRIRKRITAM